MRKLLFISGILSILLTSCQQKSNNQSLQECDFDEAAETAAILKVIEAETRCFFEGDFEGWASYWSHKDYAFQAWNNNDGTAHAALGWKEIKAQGKNWIEKYYKNGAVTIHPEVIREKPQIVFFNGQTAYLIIKQFNADSARTIFRISQETRLMEKEPDGWKIVNVTAFWDTRPPVAYNSLR